jgi:hypothetical protein
MSVWCPGAFLYLNGHLFLKIWEFLCYYFVEYIAYNFYFHLFYFFNAHDSQVWSFARVTEFLPIPFTALESFVYEFFCFLFLIFILPLIPEILSFTCSNLLAWLSTVVLFDLRNFLFPGFLFDSFFFF